MNQVSGIFKLIENITPKPDFLSDVAAFEAVIIAFLIPLSIEIISKISERYNSEVIINAFENSWGNRILTPSLLVNIVLAIGLRFMPYEEINPLAWKISAWAIFLTFIFIAVIVWRVIIRIKTFISDPEAVINKLYQDVEKSLK